MNLERMNNLVTALQEASKQPLLCALFDMGKWGHDVTKKIAHPCGTPACSMGHYAAREDLQNRFRLNSRGTICLRNNREVENITAEICNHFDIDNYQAEELFGSIGCGDASSLRDATKYVKKFIKREKKNAR